MVSELVVIVCLPIMVGVMAVLFVVAMSDAQEAHSVVRAHPPGASPSTPAGTDEHAARR